MRTVGNSFLDLDRHSLSFNLGVLEDLGPEWSNLVTVLNLIHSELSQKAFIQISLLFFVQFENNTANVNCLNIDKLLHSLNFSFSSFLLLSHSICIGRILKHSRSGFFASRHRCNVLLDIQFFLFEITKNINRFFARRNRLLNSLKVIRLSFNPMVQVNVGVAKWTSKVSLSML